MFIFLFKLFSTILAIFFWVHESVPSCAIPAGPQELGDLSEDSGLQVVCQRLPLLERHSSTHFVQAVNTAINRCRIWGRAWRLGEEHLQETSFFIHEHHGRWGFHGISWYFMVFHGISWYFMVFHGSSCKLFVRQTCDSWRFCWLGLVEGNSTRL